MASIILKEAHQLAMHVGVRHKELIDALVDRLEKWESVFGHLGEPDEVGNEWHALSERLEVAENENAKLRIALAEKVTSETMLRDLSVGNGSINALFDGGAVHLLVDAFANQFEESGAANYIEMQFHSEATGSLVATLQRVNGKTPHQLRAEAEQERDALRAKIEQMERQEPLDAGSDVFRSAFEAALRAGNWPATRQGDGYRSPSTQIAWRIAFSTVNRLKLYITPGAKGE